MADTLLFTRHDVARGLPLDVCMAAVESAFAALGRGQADPPVTVAVHTGAGAFHIKAGALPVAGRRYFAAKLNGNFAGNARQGLPTIQGVLVLADAENGRVLAVLDSTEITALRTAAATGVAARLLARADAEVAVICGCGVQGRAQLRALACSLPLKLVYACDADLDRARAYAREMSDVVQLPVTVEQDLASALARADVCVTCTTSTEFIVHRRAVRPGTFVAGVGVDDAHKRELAPDLLAAAKVITDWRAQCAGIGDLHHAIAAGTMGIADVHADLGEVVAGVRAGRETADEIIVFDSTGLAIQDVAAAVAIYEQAGAGTGAAPLRLAFA